MIFEYQQQKTFMNAIDVVDAGNMCLRCTTTEGLEYYVMDKTVCGKVHMLKIGPVVDGLTELLPGFEVSYKKFDYKEKTISKEVTIYLNDSQKKIDTVEEIQPEEAYGIFPDIAQSFKNLE